MLRTLSLLLHLIFIVCIQVCQKLLCIVGLGLWKVSGHQLDVYILTFLQRIVSFLDAGRLDHVADVNFAYIKPGKEVAGKY